MKDRGVAASLLEHLSEPGFRSSLIATYACYFPFYEEVVLRRLVSGGCTHNVLMVDATRCAEAFTREDLRPRRAGRDYTLIPIAVAGAFHPKIFLQFGKSKGSLLVGSHNLTLAGFGLNDELTNIFRAEGATARAHAGPIRSAFDFLSRFVASEPQAIIDSFGAVALGAPWLEDAKLGDDTERHFLASIPDEGTDLWSQLESLLPRPVVRAFVSGPFFDPELAFLKRVQRDVQARELVVGIDPKSVEIDPDAAAKLSDIKWVNLSGIPAIPNRREGSSHYLHAKLLWFAGKKDELLVVGSANPTVAAFLAPRGRRNAEALVADRRASAGAQIRIADLMAAPPITTADWVEVTRRREERSEAEPVEPNRRIWLATVSHQGFLSREPLTPGQTVRAIGDDGCLGTAVVSAADPRAIDASPVIRGTAQYLEAATPDGVSLLIVHRTDEIAKNLGGDSRRALQQALGAVEEDPAQLETLLKLTEKVIFDSDEVVAQTSPQGSRSAHPSQDGPNMPTTLALDALGRKSARKARTLASGDILVLLDALIRRLGEGLPSGAAAPHQQSEPEIGSDEEEGGELAPEAIDYEALAKACRGKVRRLIKRMEGQLEVSHKEGRARRATVQLAAVLGLVRALRIAEHRPEWRKRGLELVDRGDQFKLFESAVLYFAWEPDALAPCAISEVGEKFEEVSFVLGLLAWLAWDVEVDADRTRRSDDEDGDESDRWYAVQLLAALGALFADDAVATTILEESVARTPHY